MIKQTTKPLSQGTKSTAVRSTNEPNRPVDGSADRKRAVNRSERKTTGIDDDKCALAGRKMLVAACRHGPADLGQHSDRAE
jgi:hypothetical protein